MKRIVLIMGIISLISSGLIAGGAKESTPKSGEAQALQIWETLAPDQIVKNLAETPLYKEVAKRTGVQVSWIHPPKGQERENFNLMLASNELPDMIFYNWLVNFPGGPEKAILDGVIQPLNDLIAKNAPNYTKRLADRPDWAKAAKTDQGTLYSFPFIRSHDKLMVFYGPMLRKDWLDELKLPEPETMDDWYRVLTAMKTKTQGTGPLSFTAISKGGLDLHTHSPFVGAYGIAMGFYRDGGIIKFGQIEPGYKEFLKTFAKWYSEGLVDKEFITNDRATFDSKALSGKTGAYVGQTGGVMGRLLDAKKDDPKFDLVATKYPVLKKGQIPFIGQRDNPINGMGLVITTKAKNPALAARWADYAYGVEGHMLFNFGIEGESYTMVNGNPTYTDLVKKHPLGISQALSSYNRATYNGPIVQDVRHIVQYLARPQQQDALDKWSLTKASESKLPAITPSPEESRRFAAIMNEVNVYTDEMFVKFILGVESLDNFDVYVAQVKRMNIDEAIAIQTAALERYNKR